MGHLCAQEQAVQPAAARKSSCAAMKPSELTKSPTDNFRHIKKHSMAIKSIIILLKKKKILILKGILMEFQAEDVNKCFQGRCRAASPASPRPARSLLLHRGTTGPGKGLPKGWPVTSPKRGLLSKGRELA